TSDQADVGIMDVSFYISHLGQSAWWLRAWTVHPRAVCSRRVCGLAPDGRAALTRIGDVSSSNDDQPLWPTAAHIHLERAGQRPSDRGMAAGCCYRCVTARIFCAVRPLRHHAAILP